MADEAPRHVSTVGLNVTDPALYARYRAGMRPILAEYGGRFDHDFVVSEVLHSRDAPHVNRLFMISFPDREAMARFFDDPRYKAVREEFFAPSVAEVYRLGEHHEQA